MDLKKSQMKIDIHDWTLLNKADSGVRWIFWGVPSGQGFWTQNILKKMQHSQLFVSVRLIWSKQVFMSVVALSVIYAQVDVSNETFGTCGSRNVLVTLSCKQTNFAILHVGTFRYGFSNQSLSCCNSNNVAFCMRSVVNPKCMFYMDTGRWENDLSQNRCPQKQMWNFSWGLLYLLFCFSLEGCKGKISCPFTFHDPQKDTAHCLSSYSYSWIMLLHSEYTCRRAGKGQGHQVFWVFVNLNWIEKTRFHVGCSVDAFCASP